MTTSRRRGLSSLITYAVVSFTRYSYIPWLLVYLHNRKYSSWVHVVLAYGTLLTVLQIGIVCGKSISAQCKKLSTTFYSLIFMTMTSSYIIVAFITRFSFMMALFWIIGFTSSILSDFTLSLNGHNNPMVVFQKPIHSMDSEQSSIQYYREELQRQLLFFSFSTLIGGYLYDPRFHSEFPLYYLSLLLAVVCAFIIAYYWLLKYALRKKSTAQGHGHHQHHHKHSNHHATTSQVATKRVRKVLPPYTGKVPLNFLSWFRGDVKRAQEAYGQTLQFREDYQVDDIFDIPQPTFDDILQYYPHAIHGYSLDGCAVVYEVLGKGNAKGLLATGAGIDDLVWHFNLRNEFIFRNVLSPESLNAAIEEGKAQNAIQPPVFPYTPSPEAAQFVEDRPVPRLMTVIDVEGISISSVTTDVISFMKQSGEMIDKYYPEQVARLVVCKAPRWFSAVWSMIANVLPEGVQKKVDILYDSKGLDKYIHPSQRPVAYGGTDPNPLGQAPHHLAFRQFPAKWKEKEAQLQQQQALSITTNPSAAALSSISASPRKLSTSSADPTATASGSSSWKTVDISSVPNGSNKGSGGVWGWVSSKVAPLLPKGGKKVQPKSAYLGEKNSYVYNPQTRQWELEQGGSSLGGMEGIATLSSGGANMDGTSGNTGLQGGNSSSLSNRRPPLRSNTTTSARSGSNQQVNSSDDSEYSSSEEDSLSEDSSRFVARRRDTPPTPSLAANSRKKKRRSSLSKEQLEEHGLVLAIHAAHYAANYASKTGLRGSSSQLFLQNMESMAAVSGLGGNNGGGGGRENGGNGVNGSGMAGYNPSLSASRDHMSDIEGGNNANTSLPPPSPHSTVHSNTSSALSISVPPVNTSYPTALSPLPSGNPASSASTESNKPQNKVAALQFLLVGGSYCLLLILQQLLLTLLPVWWTSPLPSGGLEYTHWDIALLLSATSLCLYYFVTFGYDRIMRMIHLSPVRMLRLSAAMMFLTLWIYPWYLRWYTVPVVDYLHHYQHHAPTPSHASTHTLYLHTPPLPTVLTTAATATELFPVSTVTTTSSLATKALPFGYVGNLAEHTNGTMLVVQYLTTSLPHTTFLSLLPPTFFLAFLFSMLYIALRSMHLLLHLTFTPMFHSPADIRHTLGGICQILGPIISSLMYGLIYSMHWKYPLDTSFCVGMSACGILLVYTFCILLRVQFRGEFGLLSDEEDLTYYTMYLWGEEVQSTASHGNGYLGHTGNNTNGDAFGTGLHQRHGGGQHGTHIPSFNNNSNSSSNSNNNNNNSNIGGSNRMQYIATPGSRITVCNNSIWALPYSDWQFFRACLRHPYSFSSSAAASSPSSGSTAGSSSTLAAGSSSSLWYGNVKEDLKDV